ncbi:MAG: hypothetical protein KQH53_18735 [Desulfarculaceae bacterium]|nr:hypothetical protein [Desulfarculaceae bacterium]
MARARTPSIDQRELTRIAMWLWNRDARWQPWPPLRVLSGGRAASGRKRSGPGRAMILAGIPRWRELGTEAWLAEERRRHACPHCGAQAMRGATRCAQCRQELPAPAGA